MQDPTAHDPTPSERDIADAATRYLESCGALLEDEHVNRVVTVITITQATQGGR